MMKYDCLKLDNKTISLKTRLRKTRLIIEEVENLRQ